MYIRKLNYSGSGRIRAENERYSNVQRQRIKLSLASQFQRSARYCGLEAERVRDGSEKSRTLWILLGLQCG